MFSPVDWPSRITVDTWLEIYHLHLKRCKDCRHGTRCQFGHGLIRCIKDAPTEPDDPPDDPVVWWPHEDDDDKETGIHDQV